MIRSIATIPGYENINKIFNNKIMCALRVGFIFNL